MNNHSLIQIHTDTVFNLKQEIVRLSKDYNPSLYVHVVDVNDIMEAVLCSTNNLKKITEENAVLVITRMVKEADHTSPWSLDQIIDMASEYLTPTSDEERLALTASSMGLSGSLESIKRFAEYIKENK